MKRLILFFAFVALAAFSSDVVLFDPVSSPVVNRVTGYIPSASDIVYRGATNALIITNMAVQRTAGVTVSNLTSVCVVDGQTVRLMTQAELDRVAATNAILQSNALAQAVVEARSYASNIVNRTDGESVAIRAMMETFLALLNVSRTNAGLAAITKGNFKSMIETNINGILP